MARTYPLISGYRIQSLPGIGAQHRPVKEKRPTKEEERAEMTQWYQDYVEDRRRRGIPEEGTTFASRKHTVPPIDRTAVKKRPIPRNRIDREEVRRYLETTQLTGQQIAEAMNVSSQGVYKVAQRLGIDMVARGNKNGYVVPPAKVKYAEIAEMLRETELSGREIAVLFNVVPTTVYNAARKHHIDMPAREAVLRARSREKRAV